ncbi:MAG: LysM peptidoglycan-binding domain-containing protein [Gammaproteobacteria bacterium]
MFKAASTTTVYDAWGRKTAVQDHAQISGSNTDRVRYFAYNGDDQILAKQAGTLDTSTNDYTAETDGAGPAHYYYGAGHYLGKLNERGSSDGNGGVLGRIDFGQMPRGFEAGQGSTHYTVQAGDTLRTIAQRVYGNEALWYVVADANGFEDGSELRTGATIKLPEHVSNLNNEQSFKPYRPGEIVGSTVPNLPYVPPMAHCSNLEKAIILVLIIIITIYTAGAAAEGMSGAAAGGTAAGEGAAAGGTAAASSASFSATMDMGAAVLEGGAGTGLTAGEVMGSAFIGGFTGNLAGQVMYNIGGVQDGISFGQAAMAGLTTAATAGIARGLGSSSQLFQNHQYARIAASSAAGYMSSYAAGRITGQNVHFSWSALAAQVVTSEVSSAVFGDLGSSSAVSDGISRYGTGIIGRSVNHAFGIKDDRSNGDIAVDAFGNVLGNYLGHVYKVRQQREEVARKKAFRQLKKEVDKMRNLDGPLTEKQKKDVENLTAALLSNDSYNNKSDRKATPEGVQRITSDLLKGDYLKNLTPEQQTQVKKISPKTLALLENKDNKGLFDLYYDKKFNQFYLANRGTTGTLDDMITDAAQAWGLHTQRYQAAHTIALELQHDFSDEKNLIFTGHSLGGGLAALESLATGFKAITFNASGLSDNTIEEYGLDTSMSRQLITNYPVKNEILSSTQNNPLLDLVSGTLLTPIVNLVEASEMALGSDTARFSGWVDVPEAQGRQVELPAVNTFLNVPASLSTSETIDPFRAASPFTDLQLHRMTNVVGSLYYQAQQDFPPGTGPTGD